MTQHSRSSSFLLLTENEAPQDALLSIESIEVRPLVPKGILSVRQIVKETIGVGVNEKAVLRFYQTALSFTSISIFPW